MDAVSRKDEATSTVDLKFALQTAQLKHKPASMALARLIRLRETSLTASRDFKAYAGARLEPVEDILRGYAVSTSDYEAVTESDPSYTAFLLWLNRRRNQAS